jgi:hypothetical protein
LNSKDTKITSEIIKMLPAKKLTHTTVRSLSDTLEKYGVNIENWGKGDAKSVKQLLKELMDGESFLYLDGDRLYRTVYPIFVHIKRSDGLVLKEIEQFFHAHDGEPEKLRERSCYLAEKRFPHETIQKALERAIREELVITCTIENFTYVEKTVEETSGASYPGLYCVKDNVTVYITEKDLGCQIVDGYKVTEHFQDCSPRLTTTWGWREE